MALAKRVVRTARSACTVIADASLVRRGVYVQEEHMAEVLATLSNELASVVTSAGASVARVDARNRMPASGIVWSADGVIVTASHAVEREDNIGIGFGDEQTTSAALVGRDPTTDIAVLRAQSHGLKAPGWSDMERLRVGHLALALGRPGKTVLATHGIVSALGDSWRTPGGGRIDRYLQTDAPMHPGFSGGPLVDVSGHFIGLNTSGMMRGSSLTIPASTVKRVVETLLAHGKVRRGYLGVAAQPVRLPEAIASQLGQETGLLLVSIERGGTAEQSGLVLGDTIVSIEGQPVRHLDDLLTVLGPDRIGAELPARALRSGQLQEFRLRVGERGE